MVKKLEMKKLSVTQSASKIANEHNLIILYALSLQKKNISSDGKMMGFNLDLLITF